jgi:hypothetical protein
VSVSAMGGLVQQWESTYSLHRVILACQVQDSRSHNLLPMRYFSSFPSRTLYNCSLHPRLVRKHEDQALSTMPYSKSSNCAVFAMTSLLIM